MRYRIISILTLSASSLLASPLIGQSPLIQGPVIENRIPPTVTTNGFTGDTKFSESQEARAMSPPHWGSDKPYWPNKSPDQGPGCDTADRAVTGQQASPASTGLGSRFSLPQTGKGQTQSNPQLNGVNSMGNGTGSLNMFMPKPTTGLPSLQPWPSRDASDNNTMPGSASPNPNAGPGQRLQRYPLYPPTTGAGFQSNGTGQDQDLLNLQNGAGQSVIEPGSVEPVPFQLPQAQSGQGPPLTDGPNPVSCEDWDRGFRQSSLTVRPQVWDDGADYDFEQKKKQYPPMKEILATGRYFSMAEWQALKPSFSNNSAITLEGPGFASAIAHDFDFEAAPRFRAGFESKYGPGIELQYSQYDHLSDQTGFVSDGISNGTSSAWMLGPNRLTSLSTSAAGERLVAEHDLEVHSLQASFFKEVKLPISRINGMFGLRYVSVAQGLNSRLFDAGNNEIGQLINKTDLRVSGPTLGLEYYRPVGHTPFELIGSFNGAVLFGHRDQLVQNTGTMDFNNLGTNTFLSIIDFYGGLQYVKHTAERRSWYVRMGVTHQVWLGGGTASDPEGDFGYRGFGFAFGLNR